MPATEPIQGGPYPVPTDPPDGPAQMKGIVDWTAGRNVMRFASIAARDAVLTGAGLTDGMLCYVAATKSYYGRVNGAWVVFWRPWTTWTPTLTALATNPSLGSTGVALGKHCVIGGTVHAQGRFSFGGTGVSAGSGEYQVALPVPPKDASESHYYGSAWLFDTSGALTSLAACLVQPTGVVNFRHHGGASVVASGTPWTWATGDQIRFQLEYEGAA